METGSVQKYAMNYRMQMLTGSVKNDSLVGKSSKSEDLTSILLDFKMESYSFSLGNIKDQSSGFLGTDSSGFVSAPSTDSGEDLFGENGYWGVKKTSARIADFVLMGAGDDLERLRAGREGILAGFKDAEKIRGGNLPDISYDTIDSAVAAIDEKIRELGGNVLDIST